MVVGFVNFEDEEQLNKSSEELEGKSIGNKTLKVADVIPRSFEKKNNSTAALPQEAKENTDIHDPSNGTTTVDGDTNDSSVSNTESLRDVVTPLAHMPYVDQLEHKRSSFMQILKKLTRNTRKACPSGVSLPEWILKSKDVGDIYL
ncbi:hypothetical protein L6164_019108 [Bauhinia variegata]|uniref:Uncharacterized protein n=1 Tax=Bauhinia variegata TaxID=167791 RepID=A0ACB9NE84_BAUVA|nr:hypothetical protein L6164_019108 [Bauhinia variegata]